jgi:hypothetical protein|nr:MAG TPA: Bifunctional enzyme CysN/CysC [Caudoviricetes sp.]
MIRLITGPPASGKSTYVRDNAKPGDAIIDLDLLDGDSVLRAALEESLHLRGSQRDVWVTRTLPDPADRKGFAEYIKADSVITLNDASEEELHARLEGSLDAESRREGIRRWFSLNPRNGDERNTDMPQEILSANVGTEETPEGENLNAETATQENAAGDASEPSTSGEDLKAQIENLTKQVEQWKSHSREWEARAKKGRKSEDADDSVADRLEALQNEFSDYKKNASTKIAESKIQAGLSANGLSSLQSAFDSLGAASFLDSEGNFDQAKFDGILATLTEQMKPKASSIPSLNGAPDTGNASNNSFASGAAAVRAKFNKK